MKLFTSTRGFVIAFGFDMIARKPDIHRISWCDPSTQEWECLPTNQAGWNLFPFPIAPEFVHESTDGLIVAYQSGRCIEMIYVGTPLVWSFRTLLAEDQSPALRAA